MVRARRQFIEDLVKFYGKRNDEEKHLKRLRNKPISLHSEHRRVKKGPKPKKPKNGKKISKYEQRRLKLFQFDKSEIKYDNFVKLSELWESYILSLLPNR